MTNAANTPVADNARISAVVVDADNPERSAGVLVPPSEDTGWFGLTPQDLTDIKGKANTIGAARDLARAWFSLLQHHDDTRHQHQRLSAALDANPTPMQVGTGPKAWKELVTQLEELPTGSFGIVYKGSHLSVLLRHSDRGVRAITTREGRVTDAKTTPATDNTRIIAVVVDADNPERSAGVLVPPSEGTGWFGLTPQDLTDIKGKATTIGAARDLARAWFSLLQHHDDTRHQHKLLSAVLDANPTPMQVGTGPKAWKELVTQLEKLPTGSFAIVCRASNYSVLLHHSDRGIRAITVRDGRVTNAAKTTVMDSTPITAVVVNAATAETVAVTTARQPYNAPDTPAGPDRSPTSPDPTPGSAPDHTSTSVRGRSLPSPTATRAPDHPDPATSPGGLRRSNSTASRASTGSGGLRGRDGTGRPHGTQSPWTSRCSTVPATTTTVRRSCTTCGRCGGWRGQTSCLSWAQAPESSPPRSQRSTQVAPAAMVWWSWPGHTPTHRTRRFSASTTTPPA
ncbi:hypothetical protein HX744_13590 [Pseudonocardia sp. ICBG1122]|nr:hypothetical protein [Pseudonocardia pini]